MKKLLLLVGLSGSLLSCGDRELRLIASIPSPSGKLVAHWYAEGGNSLAASHFLVRISDAGANKDFRSGCLAWRSYRAGPKEIKWNGEHELRLMLQLSEQWQQLPTQQHDCLGVKTTVELVSPPPLKEYLQKNR